MEKGDATGSNFRQTVQPLLTLLRVAGVYTDSKSFKWRIMQILYCFLVNTTYWLNIARLLVSYRHPDSIDGNILINSSVVIFYLASSVISNSITVTSPAHVPRILAAVQKLHDTYGDPPFMKNGESRLLKLVIIVPTLTCLSGAGLFLWLVYSDEVKEGRMWVMSPLTYTEPELYTAFIPVLMVLTLLQFLGYVSVVLMFGLSCYLLCEGFSCNGKRLKSIIGRTENSVCSASDVENIRLHHESLVQLVNKFNRLYSFPIIVLYTTVIPFMCFMVYGLITECLTLAFTIQTTCCVVFVVSSAVAITLAGVFVTTKAHSANDVILQMDFTCLHKDVARSVSVFLSRLTGNPVGFWAGGMFMVNWSAILMIFGLVATYTVVIFQSNLPRGCPGAAMNTSLAP